MADRIYDAFDRIKASEKNKVSTRQMIKKEAEKRRGPAPFAGRVLAVCVSLFVVLGLGGLYGVSIYPTSYVSIDVNPSIELSLNCWNRVISATAYNSEGVRILDAVSVKGMQFENALETIVGNEAMVQYLNSGADVTVTIAAGSQSRQMQISESVNNCGSHHGYHISGYIANMETVSEAHHNGMSIGKYDAYVKLYGYDDTVTVEDCRDMSVSEIRSLIHEHETDSTHHSSGGGSSDSDGNCDGGSSDSNGSGSSDSDGNGDDGGSSDSDGNGDGSEHGHDGSGHGHHAE